MSYTFAKIRNKGKEKFDVIDEYKNQKWLTKEEARCAANWFIENFDSL